MPAPPPPIISPFGHLYVKAVPTTSTTTTTTTTTLFPSSHLIQRQSQQPLSKIPVPTPSSSNIQRPSMPQPSKLAVSPLTSPHILQRASMPQPSKLAVSPLTSPHILQRASMPQPSKPAVSLLLPRIQRQNQLTPDSFLVPLTPSPHSSQYSGSSAFLPSCPNQPSSFGIQEIVPSSLTLSSQEPSTSRAWSNNFGKRELSIISKMDCEILLCSTPKRSSNSSELPNAHDVSSQQSNKNQKVSGGHLERKSKKSKRKRKHRRPVYASSLNEELDELRDDLHVATRKLREKDHELRELYESHSIQNKALHSEILGLRGVIDTLQSKGHYMESNVTLLEEQNRDYELQTVELQGRIDECLFNLQQVKKNLSVSQNKTCELSALLDIKNKEFIVYLQSDILESDNLAAKKKLKIAELLTQNVNSAQQASRSDDMEQECDIDVEDDADGHEDPFGINASPFHNPSNDELEDGEVIEASSESTSNVIVKEEV